MIKEIIRDDDGTPIVLKFTDNPDDPEFYCIPYALIKWDGCAELFVDGGATSDPPIHIHICCLPLFIESLQAILNRGQRIFNWERPKEAK